MLSSLAVICTFATAGTLLPLGCCKAHAQEAGPELVPPVELVFDNEEGDAEHLLSGPMHEAFAAPVTFDAKPGLIVAAEPPQPIDEMPPDVRPEADAIWIPGYWAWDDQREAFLWVSGVYRVPPSGRRWVPGYWLEVEDGYQWVAGFWAPLEENELTYLPDPPETVEHAPSSPAPSDEHFWVSGHWNYDNTRYVWRPGYWTLGHERWVWIPAHYVWTPRGCVFVPGYWDYRLVDRGMCFAPVYWRRPVYLHAGFYYRPYRVIDLVRLHLHMFVRPNYYHYYYGDWYGTPRWGIYASFTFHGRYGYDPLWTYHRWYFGRQGIDYHSRVRGWHDYYARHEDRRPPRTWHDQQRFADHHRSYEHLRHVTLGRDLKDYASSHPRRVAQVAEQDRQRMRDGAQAMREFGEVRRDGERDRRPQADRGQRPERELGRLTLPETPDVRHLRERTTSRDPSQRQPPDARPEARTEHWPGTRPEARPTPRPEARPESRPMPRLESRPMPRPEGRPEGRPESRQMPRSETQPTPQSETRPAPRLETRPTPRPEARPEGRPIPRPEGRPEGRPESRQMPRSETQPTPQSETRPAPRLETRPTPRPEARPEGRPIPRPESRPEGRLESRQIPRSETRPAPRPETRSTPRAEGQSTPRPETRPTPRPETRSTPRPEGRTTPRPETRSTPRPETRPTPRPETRSTPRPEGRTTPRPETRSTPRPEGRPEGGRRR
jgi:hypothetical protein